ncbi:hypothetical protein CDAR_211691 [Caerostris darwini]|uniref:Uncharacterized protein n=1 Tax=Caerostris darwini TaxID=1538125 RepID=A0AAV4RZD3_9ARAC|nr:hypothetical protein CDAR_211691 [Caerostris darwini]
MADGFSEHSHLRLIHKFQPATEGINGQRFGNRKIVQIAYHWFELTAFIVSVNSVNKVKTVLMDDFYFELSPDDLRRRV